MNDEEQKPTEDEEGASFIRNPKRNAGQELPQEAPIPEHQRLGLNPYQRAFMGDNPPPSFLNQVLSAPPSMIEDETALPHFPRKEHPKTKKDPLKIGECILMIDGKIILTGSMEEVLKEARSILYGENEQFESAVIAIDDIIILKRMNLKVGVFLDE